MLARWACRTSPQITKFSRAKTSISVSSNSGQTRQPVAELPSELSEAQIAASVIHGRAAFAPYYHPRTHNIPVAIVHFRAHHHELLDLFIHFATHAASALAIPISRPVFLPTQRSLWTVPRGPFVHKKAQENFERKVHKRAIKAWDADGEVVERWIRYLQQHMVGGVGMRVVRWERMPVGVGQQTWMATADALKESVTDGQKVKALGEEIVKQELASAASASEEMKTSRPD